MIRWLSQMDFEDDLLALNAKTVLLKAYYEKGELESLEYLLESFKSYIQRKNLQGFYKDYFLTLVKAVKKMIHCTRPSQVLKLKHEVESVSKMAAKEWLLEQLNQVLR